MNRSRRLDITEAIVAAANTAPAAAHGQRRPDYAEPSACRCEAPEARLFEHEGTTYAICDGCTEPLNLDTLGIPFKRWPGDMTSADATMRRVVASAHDEMQTLVRSLPKLERERLARISLKNPARFEREARAAIRRHDALQESAGVDVHPHERRRRQALAQDDQPE